MKTLWVVAMVVLCWMFYDEVSANNTRSHLAGLSWEVNQEYKFVENNCLIVAMEKKKKLGGQGKILCINVDKKYLPIKRHCFLEIDDCILDNGWLFNNSNLVEKTCIL